MSGLPLSFWRATHAGAKTIPMVNMHANAYLMINKKLISFNICFCIKGGHLYAPPIYSFRRDYKPYFADLSSSSSIRISWLYFAMRSVRDIEPVLI